MHVARKRHVPAPQTVLLKVFAASLFFFVRILHCGHSRAMFARVFLIVLRIR